MYHRAFFVAILLGLNLVSSSLLTAQIKDPSDCSGILISDSVIPEPYIREADLMWSGRHWERIDLREKMNQYLYYPLRPLPCRKSLFDALLDGLKDLDSPIEIFADDHFEIPISQVQVLEYIQMVDTLRDPDTGEILLIDTISITAKDVKFWELRTDWYFDKSRGELRHRLLGISPVVENPKTLDRYNLFWIWYPSARKKLASSPAYIRQNQLQHLNYDQVLNMRFFNSVIFKEDNDYDRTIEEYKRSSTLDQLLEADRIKNKLRNFEAELWEY